MTNFPEDTEYDDDLSPGDIAAIEDGLEDIRAGRLTPIKDVRRELGWKPTARSRNGKRNSAKNNC